MSSSTLGRRVHTSRHAMNAFSWREIATGVNLRRSRISYESKRFDEFDVNEIKAELNYFNDFCHISFIKLVRWFFLLSKSCFFRISISAGLSINIQCPSSLTHRVGVYRKLASLLCYLSRVCVLIRTQSTGHRAYIFIMIIIQSVYLFHISYPLLVFILLPHVTW